MLAHLNVILQIVPKVEQLLSYDTTDMEMGIVNAAEAEMTLKVVGCWRHCKKGHRNVCA